MSFRICNAPRVLLLCAAGWLASAASSPAAVLTVNNGGDSTVAGDGQVTLREAVIAAETDTVTDLGQTGSGPDRIDLTAFTGDFFILLAGPLPDITSTIELVGAGAAALRLGVSGGIGRLARIDGGRLGVSGGFVATRGEQQHGNDDGTETDAPREGPSGGKHGTTIPVFPRRPATPGGALSRFEPPGGHPGKRPPKTRRRPSRCRRASTAGSPHG